MSTENSSPEVDQKAPRIITPMEQNLVDRIDDFRFTRRIPSRAEAIRRLIESGLVAEGASNQPAP